MIATSCFGSRCWVFALKYIFAVFVLMNAGLPSVIRYSQKTLKLWTAFLERQEHENVYTLTQRDVYIQSSHALFVAWLINWYNINTEIALFFRWSFQGLPYARLILKLTSSMASLTHSDIIWNISNIKAGKNTALNITAIGNNSIAKAIIFWTVKGSQHPFYLKRFNNWMRIAK